MCAIPTTARGDADTLPSHSHSPSLQPSRWRTALLAASLAGLAALPVHAAALSDNVVRIGVLTDIGANLRASGSTPRAST